MKRKSAGAINKIKPATAPHRMSAAVTHRAGQELAMKPGNPQSASTKSKGKLSDGNASV